MGIKIKNIGEKISRSVAQEKEKLVCSHNFVMSALEPGLENAPEFISICGRKGKNTVINGKYQRGEHTHCGKVYYEKCDIEDRSDHCVIRWHPGGIWMFGPRLAYDLKGFACVKDHAENPCEVTQIWRVFNETGFETEPNLKIVADKRQHDDLKELNELNELLEDEVKDDGHNKNSTPIVNEISSQIYE